MTSRAGRPLSSCYEANVGPPCYIVALDERMTMYNFPEPIAEDACAVCVGEARGWTSYSTRSRTLCNRHYQEWVDDKTYNDF